MGIMGLFSTTCVCQKEKPGLEGMAPSRWITFKYSDHIGLRVQSHDQLMNAEQEDLFFKLWVPVLHKPKFTFMIGPQYRTEQLEFEKIASSDEVVSRLSSWNLRFWGLDFRSVMRASEKSWYAFDFMLNQSGTLQDDGGSIPVNYTFSAARINKKSSRKEIGYGLLVNLSGGRLIPLPIFIMNYNFSSRFGVEIGLPKKLAFRYNATDNDRFYLKTEASSRNYFVTGDGIQSYDFRRTDVNLGIAYNRQLNKLIGFELFGGYRKNITHRLPETVQLVRASGPVITAEVFVKVPSLKK
jgi:hypothetical protein